MSDCSTLNMLTTAFLFGLFCTAGALACGLIVLVLWVLLPGACRVWVINKSMGRWA